ncbi:MAG TPA: Yip1 family protein [Caulobacteraceae bacterium]
MARVQNILLKPAAEWAVIDGEPATVPGLFTSYAVVVAILPVIGSILGGLVGALVFHAIFGLVGGLVSALIGAIFGYVIGLVAIYVFSFIINALASSFNATPNPVQAAKVAVYGATASWVAGLFSFVPVLGIIIAIAGFAYSCYLWYLGIVALMKPPADKAVVYAIASIAIYIVLFGIAFWLVALISGLIIAMTIGAAAMTGAAALGGFH